MRMLIHRPLITKDATKDAHKDAIIAIRNAILKLDAIESFDLITAISEAALFFDPKQLHFDEIPICKKA